MRSFQLPVGSKELQTGAHKEYLDASKAATLIVSFLVSSVPPLALTGIHCIGY